MSAAHVATRIRRILGRHGASATLKRRKDDGTWDVLAVKAKIFNPRLQVENFDGETGSAQRVLIGNAEIAASSLPSRYPRGKDQLVVDGVAQSIESVNTMRDGDTVLMHELYVIGVID